MTKSSDSLLSSILRIMFIFAIAVVILLAAFFIILRFAIKGNVVEVPDVTGKSLVEATQILSRSNLGTPKIEGEKYSGDIPKDYIVDQKPKPGSKVKSGRQIKVFVSKGAEAGIVPRVIGKTVPEAQYDLEARGLEIGLVLKVHSDDFPQKDYIIAHTPPPDAAVQKGTKVNLLLSLGPYYTQLTMPDIEGMDLRSATEFLKSRGFTIGLIEHEVSPETNEADIILEQTPQPGDRVQRGAVVNVIVSSVAQ